jgi:hypothetical protein
MSASVQSQAKKRREEKRREEKRRRLIAYPPREQNYSSLN